MKINIMVKTRMPQNKIIKQNNHYLVHVKSVPEEGRANKEIINLFRKRFKKPVRIISGLRSKNKVLETY